MIQIQLKNYIVIRGKLVYNLEINNKDFVKFDRYYIEIKTSYFNGLIPNENVKIVLFDYTPFLKKEKINMEE